MLVLTRRIGEKIRIQDGPTGNPIIISVLGYRGNQVKLGFEGSTTVKVDRLEIYERAHANES